MTGHDKPPSLGDLNSRLKAARKKAAAHDPDSGGSGRGLISGSAAQALRLGMEMLAALVVGGAIGFFLDRWLGTRPWLLLVCLLFGVAAGFVNAYRVSQRISRDPEADPDGPE